MSITRSFVIPEGARCLSVTEWPSGGSGSVAASGGGGGQTERYVIETGQRDATAYCRRELFPDECTISDMQTGEVVSGPALISSSMGTPCVRFEVGQRITGPGLSPQWPWLVRLAARICRVALPERERVVTHVASGNRP